MMKSGTIVLVVDSVDKAVKFYTEKLFFDIIELSVEKNEGAEDIISYAHIRKGKCFIIFRAPHIEELAEFSFIKRCSSRSVGIFAEMKKGIEKYYNKCEQKGLQIISPLKDSSYGYKEFSLKDPFGIKLTFAQALDTYKAPDEFLHSGINKKDVSSDFAKNKELQEKMIKYLKSFGVLRRASKKYTKLWLKKAK